MSRGGKRMVRYKNGDILTSRADFICHQVDCQGVADSGLVRKIRTKYPEVYQHYIRKCRTEEGLLGTYMVDRISSDQTVVSLFSQNGCGKNGRITDYKAFRKCLRTLFFELAECSVIAMPCELDGGDWNTVFRILKEELGDFELELWKND